MSDDLERSRRLAELDAKLSAAKGTEKAAHTSDTHYEQAHAGWRMVIELVAGILIGFGIGYGLDWLFGTMPIFLVLFILLGLAAGIRTMMRTAQEIQDGAIRAEKDKGDEVGD